MTGTAVNARSVAGSGTTPLVVPGKQRIPIWLTIVVGIAAAFIGTFIAGVVGVADVDWLEFVIQVIVAAIGVLVVVATYGRRRARR